MKLCSSLVFIIAAATADAFQQAAFVAKGVAAGAGRPTTTSTATSTSCLFANSNNIRAAMEASEVFGATSAEARVAWEVVEEFDARDNSAAFEGNEDQRMSDAQLAQANAEVQASMEMIQRHD